MEEQRQPTGAVDSLARELTIIYLTDRNANEKHAFWLEEELHLLHCCQVAIWVKWVPVAAQPIYRRQKARKSLVNAARCTGIGGQPSNATSTTLTVLDAGKCNDHVETVARGIK